MEAVGNCRVIVRHPQNGRARSPASGLHHCRGKRATEVGNTELGSPEGQPVRGGGAGVLEWAAGAVAWGTGGLYHRPLGLGISAQPAAHPQS